MFLFFDCEDLMLLWLPLGQLCTLDGKYPSLSDGCVDAACEFGVEWVDEFLVRNFDGGRDS